MEKQEVLKNVFGYDSFREGQEMLVDDTLQGKDVLGIMPTGAGKSLCFQVPALLLEGITIVVSPLISLMKDQVSALNALGVHAAFINSSLTEGQCRRAMAYAREGRYKIIYAAPERLETEAFGELARQVKISLVAVDEAHCISQWGQDFRPSYLKIADFIQGLPVRPVIAAYTATATREVREDILCILGLVEPTVLVTGYDRKNLYFEVKKPKDKSRELLVDLQRNPDKSGIIYCSTRKAVEEVQCFLQAAGYPAVKYHAGLSEEERRRSQEDFIYDRAPVMVATNAFGMGIDKSNVRYVIHYNMPKDIESYYQEAGRAGRDGEPAHCVLYYSGQDKRINEFLIEKQMEHAELPKEDRAVVQERSFDRLQKMTFYCFTNDCLRDYILRYFGEYGGNYCGNCSNCQTQFETADVTEEGKTLTECVRSCGQRYGMTVIVDTVRGADTAKIRQYKMKENPCYGALAAVPVYRLRQILQYLLLQEYLQVTNDAYTLVKLGKNAEKLLAGEERLQIKFPKERETSAGGARKKKSAQAAALTEEDEALFGRLKALRMQIAREEHVPPYIVFSDKTLRDMCQRRPGDAQELLDVSGVGAYKAGKYGQRFLACIREG